MATGEGTSRLGHLNSLVTLLICRVEWEADKCARMRLNRSISCVERALAYANPPGDERDIALTGVVRASYHAREPVVALRAFVYANWSSRGMKSYLVFENVLVRCLQKRLKHVVPAPPPRGRELLTW